MTRGIFRSYRSRLLASFLSIGTVVLAVTYWLASSEATSALRQTTYERLTAIREIKRQSIEDYFRDLMARVLALSADESTIVALERFSKSWAALPAPDMSAAPSRDLLAYYRDIFAPTVAGRLATQELLTKWFPQDAAVRALQWMFISQSPHALGSKDLLLDPPGNTAYGEVHARYHPTFHHYRTAFSFYDLFLIDREGRILYTVSKEIDLGMQLTAEPYRETTLARAFDRAMAQTAPGSAAIVDYAPYMPSHLAPAAFAAAPIWRAGAKIGVLAIQVSITHVNRVMTGDRHWHQEGLGRTGQAYLVGPDGTLRSDLRFDMEEPEAFFREMENAGVPRETVERVRRNGTGILTLKLPEHIVERLRTGQQGIEVGRGIRNTEVIRSFTPLKLQDLAWTLVADMETEEAFAPVSALRNKLLATGAGAILLFLAAASLLARSVTKPIRALLHGTQRISGRDFGVRLNVPSSDEIGQLAESFNAMTERLEQTTVSRDELDRVNRELQDLTGRLIRAQEFERSRLARELHDDLTQRLAGVAIAAGNLKRRPDAVALQPELDRIQQQLVRISQDVHGLSRRLHPATLEELGLVGAIEGECRGFFERTGTPVEFQHQGNLEEIQGEARLAVFRIVQEALRNTSRYAEAQHVGIELKRSEESLTLRIEDDGRGFDPERPENRGGLGLASMSERARLLGGEFLLQSKPGKGTQINVSVPV